MYSNIPIELTQRKQWVLWQYEEREGKKTKVPYSTSGRRAKSTDPQTWDSYESVIAIKTKVPTYEGIGYVFAADDPYTGIDLDDCIDADTTIKPWGSEIISKLDSYAEISPSGTGVKIWIKGKLPGKGHRKQYHDGEIELYDCERYFAVTGNALGSATVNERQAQLDELYTKLFPPQIKDVQSAPAAPPLSLTLTDAELLEKAFKAKNGSGFRRLWNGDKAQFDGDDSRADLSLCTQLAFWTGEYGRIDSLFRQSGLMREKWEREDYRALTIQKAIDGCRDVYKPSQNVIALDWKGDGEAISPAEIQLDPFDEKIIFPLELSKLPKRVSTIASYLAIGTADEVRLKHLFAALAIIGAAVGKRVEFRNRGSDYYLNLVIAILARSGSNKSGLYSTVKRLTKNLIKSSNPTASTLEGFLDQFCQTLPPDKKRSRDERNRLVNEMMALDAANHDGDLLVIDELRAMLLTLLPKEQAARNGQILCRLMDRDDIYCTTATGGTRVLGDTCFSILGFSVVDPWNEEIRSATLQKGGLAGRILPINETTFDVESGAIDATLATVEEAERAIIEIKNLVRGTHAESNPFAGTNDIEPKPKKIQITFGEGDGLKRAKEWFAARPEVAAIRESQPHEFEVLESKILMQAAKVAAILAISDAAQWQSEIDCESWLRLAMILVGYSHLGNLGHLSQLTEQGQLFDRIRRALKRHRGRLTQTELSRLINLKPFEILGYLNAMLAAGELVKTSGKRKDSTIWSLAKID